MATRNPLTGFTDVFPQQSLGRTNIRSPRTPTVPMSDVERYMKQQQALALQRSQAQQGSPSGFVSAMQNVGGALSPLLSGEEFLNLVPGGNLGTYIREGLEDIPTVGGFLGLAFDVGASPLTLLTGGFGGAIGSSVGGLARFGAAGRAAAGTTRALTSPLIQKGNIAQRIGAETALLAGAESAQKALDLPAWTQLAGIGIGLKGLGQAQKTGIGRTLFGEPGSGPQAEARRIAEEIIEGDIKSATLAERVAAQAKRRKENPQQIMSVTYKDADAINVRDLAAVGIKPTRGSLFKGARGLVEALELQANNLRTTMKGVADSSNERISKYATEKDSYGNRVFKNKDGIVIRDYGNPEKPAALGDVLEFLDSRYKNQIMEVDPDLYESLSNLRKGFTSIAAEKQMHSIGILNKTEGQLSDLAEGQSYVPRFAILEDTPLYKGKNIDSAKKYLYMNKDNARDYKTFREGVEALGLEGRKYEDPVEALSHFADDAAKDITNYEVGKAIAAFADETATGVLNYETRMNIMRVVNDAISRDKRWKRAPFRSDGYKDQSYIESKKRLQQATDFEELSDVDQHLFLLENPQFRPFVDAASEEARFQENIARDIVKAFTPDTKGRWDDSVVAALNKVNKEIVPLRSTLDISGGLVTNAIAMWNNPWGFLKNMGSALRDSNIGRQTRVNEFFESPQWRGGLDTNPDSKTYNQFFEGAAKYVTGVNPVEPYAMKEFIVSGGEGTLKKALKKGTAPFNRNFAMIGNRNRMTMFYDAVEVYSAALESAARKKGLSVGKSANLLDDKALREIGRAVDRATGIASAKAGDRERAYLFAPNFYRSMFETIGNLASDGTIEGDLARKYVSNMIAGGTTTLAAYALYTDRDPSDVLSIFDGDALEKGELKMNPNFGTMRIGGRDVNIWGPYDSLVRLTLGAASMAEKLPEEKQGAFMDYMTYATRTKGSPGVSYLTNMILGETFTGRDFLSAEGQLSQVLPFSATVGIEEGTDAFAATGSLSEALIQGGLGAVLSASGMKENPVTPFEELDMIARSKKELGYRPYAELTPQERAAIDEENPEVVARLEASNRYNKSPEGKMARWRNDDLAKLKDEQQQALEKLQIDGNRYEFRKIMDALAERHSLAGRLKEEDLGVEYDPPTSGTPKAVLAQYYNILDNARDPLTQVLDWDTIESEISKLENDIASGVYGPPDRAQEFLNERVVFRGNPSVEWFFDNKNTIRSVEMDGFNYWNQKDKAFDEFSKVVTKAAGRNVGTYNGLLEEIVQAKNDNNIRKLTLLKTIRNRIDRRTDIYRKRMRRKNPEVEKALMENGYLS